MPTHAIRNGAPIAGGSARKRATEKGSKRNRFGPFLMHLFVQSLMRSGAGAASQSVSLRHWKLAKARGRCQTTKTVNLRPRCMKTFPPLSRKALFRTKRRKAAAVVRGKESSFRSIIGSTHRGAIIRNRARLLGVRNAHRFFADKMRKRGGGLRS